MPGSKSSSRSSSVDQRRSISWSRVTLNGRRATSSTRAVRASIISRDDPPCTDDPPCPEDRDSWPPSANKSYEYRRYTSGFPDAFYPSRPGTAPGGSPTSHDHYRKELKEKGIPRSSKFHIGCKGYKSAELAFDYSKKEYQEHLASEKAPSRSERNKAPAGSWVGQPLGKPSYHDKAADYAAYAALQAE